MALDALDRHAAPGVFRSDCHDQDGNIAVEEAVDGGCVIDTQLDEPCLMGSLVHGLRVIAESPAEEDARALRPQRPPPHRPVEERGSEKRRRRRCSRPRTGRASRLMTKTY